VKCRLYHAAAISLVNYLMSLNLVHELALWARTHMVIRSNPTWVTFLLLLAIVNIVTEYLLLLLGSIIVIIIISRPTDSVNVNLSDITTPLHRHVCN
jgi:hypothetical protein